MTYGRETLIVKREARPRADGRWLIAYSRREERMAYSRWLRKSTVCREEESIIGFSSSNSDS